MKRLSILLATAAFGLAAVPVHATLIDRGGGLIYDTDLNITWLQDANYAMTSGYDDDGMMTWSEAVTWAENLVYGGYSDWRLPTIVPQSYDWGYDGTTGFGYNITTGSELGHLYYTELGNKAPYATDGTNPQPGWGFANTGLFINLEPYIYWSGTGYTPGPYDAWAFFFSYGSQGVGYNSDPSYALAVRSGDVAVSSVPEPGTMILMGTGLAGLALWRKKFWFKRG